MAHGAPGSLFSRPAAFAARRPPPPGHKAPHSSSARQREGMRAAYAIVSLSQISLFLRHENGNLPPLPSLWELIGGGWRAAGWRAAGGRGARRPSDPSSSPSTGGSGDKICPHQAGKGNVSFASSLVKNDGETLGGPAQEWCPRNDAIPAAAGGGLSLGRQPCRPQVQAKVKTSAILSPCGSVLFCHCALAGAPSFVRPPSSPAGPRRQIDWPARRPVIDCRAVSRKRAAFMAARFKAGRSAGRCLARPRDVLAGATF